VQARVTRKTQHRDRTVVVKILTADEELDDTEG
jgi:hypothetical protein